jgi:hypothetical protein
MDTARTSLRTAAAAHRVPRFLAVLALAAALVAIPAARPQDAGALRMSEGTARWLCSHAGGSIWTYGEYGNNVFVTCMLPSGQTYFDCGYLYGVGFADGGVLEVDPAWNCG